MNRPRRLVPIGHSLDQDARAKGHIASGKDTGGGRHKVFVDLENSARSNLHAFFAAQKRKVGLLADGENHAVAGNDLLFVAEGGIEAAILIEDSEAAANLQASNNAVFADDLFGTPSVFNCDTFVFGLIHFALPRRHLHTRFQAH